MIKNNYLYACLIFLLVSISILTIGCGSASGGGGGGGGGGAAVYTLTLSASTEIPTTESFGKVTPSPSTEGLVYSSGTAVKLTAEALSAAYMFSSWEGSISGVELTKWITMESDMHVLARFKIIPPGTTYQLSITVTPEGSGTVEPWGGVYSAGDPATITADAYGEYSFYRWSGDLSGSDNPKTFPMNGNINVTAEFTVVVATPEYVLTINATNGHVDHSGSSPYLSGTIVTLLALADPGYGFDHWEGALSGSTNPTTIEMNTTKEVTAVFLHLYNLSVSVTPEGAGTVEPWGGTYADGTNVLLTAEAGSGYAFDHWSGDLSGSDNPKSITMSTTRDVTAVFAAIPLSEYALVINVTPELAGCSVAQSGTSPYTAGTIVTLTAEAGPGYNFDHWSGDLSGSTNPTTIEMDTTKEVTAVFAMIPPAEYPLTVNVTPEGVGCSVAQSGTSPYTAFTIVTLTAEAGAGYNFDHWTGDLSGSTNPATIEMNSTKEVTAVFNHLYTFSTTVSPSVAGSITLSPSGGTYVEGTVVTMEATAANLDYVFDHWKEGSNPDDPTYPKTVVMDSSKNIWAYFNHQEVKSYFHTVSGTFDAVTSYNIQHYGGTSANIQWYSTYSTAGVLLLYTNYSYATNQLLMADSYDGSSVATGHTHYSNYDSDDNYLASTDHSPAGSTTGSGTYEYSSGKMSGFWSYDASSVLQSYGINTYSGGNLSTTKSYNSGGTQTSTIEYEYSGGSVSLMKLYYNFPPFTLISYSTYERSSSF